MRHLHATDVRFLESFFDQGVAKATPINTIAVLSRADEIGVGRLDALTLGAPDRPPVPGRRQDPRAVPDRGRGGRAARPDRAHHAPARVRRADRAGRAAARRPGRDAAVGRPVLPHRAGRARTPTTRAAADGAVRAVRGAAGHHADPAGHDRPEPDRRPSWSGAAASTSCARVLATQFTERRDLLKARSALLAIDLVLTREPRPGVGAAGRRGGAHPGRRARVRRAAAALHAALRGGQAAHRGAATRPSGCSAARAARPPPGSGWTRRPGPDELRAAALDAVTRWQRRAESPMSGRAVADVARVVVRSVEGVLAGLGLR